VRSKLALLGALGLLVPITACTDEFKAYCVQSGGVVFEKSHMDYGVTSSGRITWVQSNIRFCKKGGVIIDVE
jgi:hypothetical protein